MKQAIAVERTAHCEDTIFENNTGTVEIAMNSGKGCLLILRVACMYVTKTAVLAASSSIRGQALILHLLNLGNTDSFSFFPFFSQEMFLPPRGEPHLKPL